MRLKLPIYFSTEESDHLTEGGIDVDFKYCQIRSVIFYRIDSIQPHCKNYIPDGNTIINSGGEEYICPLSMDEVDKLVMKDSTIYS